MCCPAFLQPERVKARKIKESRAHHRDCPNRLLPASRLFSDSCQVRVRLPSSAVSRPVPVIAEDDVDLLLLLRLLQLKLTDDVLLGSLPLLMLRLLLLDDVLLGSFATVDAAPAAAGRCPAGQLATVDAAPAAAAGSAAGWLAGPRCPGGWRQDLSIKKG